MFNHMDLTAKRRVIRLHFENDPVASSILYTVRDHKKVINCAKKRKLEVNEVKNLENQLSKAELRGAIISSVDPTLTQVTDEISLTGSSFNEIQGLPMSRSASISFLDSTLTQVTDDAATPTKASKKGGSDAIRSKRGRSKKTPTKIIAEGLIAEGLGSFPKNVKCLLGTGMLDGVPVQYLSASRENELRGMIKGSSYLCGCKSCNYSKEVNADEFENHADCKTSHPNNHIHLENGKTLHQVVQELKNTPRSLLCDAIQSVLGTSLNQEAFSLWKESFGAQECSSQEEI